MRTIEQSVSQCSSLILAVSILLLIPLPARAEAALVGVVIDYQPRLRIGGKSAISIKRYDGDVDPVREHEVIYEGDSIVFEPGAGPKAFVKTLIATHKEVILDPAHPALPEQSPSFLQSLVPKILAAYRWVNSVKESDDDEPRNALSRGKEIEPESLSVLPNSPGPFKISDRGGNPLWIAWSGGIPPFKVSLSGSGNPLLSVICGSGAEDTCVREAIFQGIGDGSERLKLTIESANGSTWSEEVSRGPITWSGDLADATSLGELGVFLRATDLLERKDGSYVLESARELASISGDYPPARTLLGRIRDGKVP